MLTIEIKEDPDDPKERARRAAAKVELLQSAGVAPPSLNLGTRRCSLSSMNSVNSSGLMSRPRCGPAPAAAAGPEARPLAPEGPAAGLPAPWCG
mgnify:CR=1 FL=1